MPSCDPLLPYRLEPKPTVKLAPKPRKPRKRRPQRKLIAILKQKAKRRAAKRQAFERLWAMRRPAPPKKPKPTAAAVVPRGTITSRRPDAAALAMAESDVIVPRGT